MPTGVYQRKPCPAGCVCGKHSPRQTGRLSAAMRRVAAHRTPEHLAALSQALQGNRNREQHGDSPRGGASPEYNAWRNMRARCGNPRHPRFKDYGGRGITVDPRWDDFEVFLADVGRRPGPSLSLDRIDNDGPYAPGNVRWATAPQQMSNRRRPAGVAA